MGSIRFSEVNRTFLSLYRGVFEASTITVDENGSPIEPYYDKDLVNYYLVNYFKNTLSKYVTDYQVKIYYFDRDTGLEIFDEKCRDVNVTLKAKINYFFTYEKSENYSIIQRGEL